MWRTRIEIRHHDRVLLHTDQVTLEEETIIQGPIIHASECPGCVESDGNGMSPFSAIPPDTSLIPLKPRTHGTLSVWDARKIKGDDTAPLQLTVRSKPTQHESGSTPTRGKIAPGLNSKTGAA